MLFPRRSPPSGTRSRAARRDRGRRRRSIVSSVFLLDARTWNGEVHECAAALRVPDIDAAALRLDDRAADRQAEADAGGAVAADTRAVEAVEDTGALRGRDPRALVAHVDPDKAVSVDALDEDVRSFRRVFRCVRDEIRQHLAGAARIGEHPG